MTNPPQASEYVQAEAAFRQFIREKTAARQSFGLMSSEAYQAWAALGASHDIICAAWHDEADRVRAEQRAAPSVKPSQSAEPKKAASPTTTQTAELPPFPGFSSDQSRKAREWLRFNEKEDDEAQEIFYALDDELGEKRCDRLLELVKAEAKGAGAAKAGKNSAKARGSKGPRKPARRVSRSPETWRILANYPRYEISSHGRVRSLDRAKPDDWLKPRRRWYRGLCAESVVLLDKDGIRRERDIGWLLVAAGFMERPKWANQKREEV